MDIHSINSYEIIDIIINIAAAVIAAIAIIISSKAIRISNKQSLFAKRIGSYSKALTLLSSFEAANIVPHKYDDSVYAIYKINFYDLTGNNLLFETMPVVDDIREELEYTFSKYGMLSDGSLDDNVKAQERRKQRFELKRTFYLELENLKTLSKEIQFLFKKESGMLLSQFVFEYQSLLKALYEYTFADEKATQERMQENQRNKDGGEEQKYIEPTVKKEMEEYNHLQICIEKINEIYEQIREKNVIGKIEKQIEF